MDTYSALATKATISGTPVTDMTVFANEYLNVFTTGFHYAFGVAILAMVLSLVIFVINRKKLPHRIRQTMHTCAVLPLVRSSPLQWHRPLLQPPSCWDRGIFFWFSFHQNGLTLTYFAKEYTDLNLFGMAISA